MDTLPALFRSAAAFEQTFDAGLQQLLARHHGLGVFILVLANVNFRRDYGSGNSAAPPSAASLTHLDQDLQQRFTELARQYTQALRNGETLGEADDDLMVFLKLMALGRNILAPMQFCHIGQWELQYNPLRAMRPARMSQQKPGGLQTPFRPEGFHFNKPFLQKETFWSGELLGRPVSLLYNKFPFAPLHGLLVPEPEAEHPQFLTETMHRYVWQLMDRLRKTLPGIALGYNAFGAFASVNHLHFQSFVRDTPLPIEHAHWQHNGGSQAWPLHCQRLNDCEHTWQTIEHLHRHGITYNLLYRPGSVWCVAHRHQGDFELADWATGLSWCELSGSLITVQRQYLETLDEAQIGLALAAARLDTNPFQ